LPAGGGSVSFRQRFFKSLDPLRGRQAGNRAEIGLLLFPREKEGEGYE